MQKKRLKKGAVIAVAGIAVFLAAGYILMNMRLFAGEDNLSEEMEPPPASSYMEEFGASERANILLLGLNQGMTDTIMVASYDMKNQHVDLISVPRDTYYERKGASGASLKINSIYHSKKGGVVTLAEAVSKVLNGMPIHYYMAVDYEGVGNIVDAIGGVWYDVPFHMKYDDTTKGIEDLHIDIPAGRQHLDRENAVEFLRFRKTNDYYKRQGYHGYPDEDIGRIKAQQKFMEEAFRQALGPQLPKVVATVLENVESDLDGKTAFRLATKAASLTGDSVTGWTLPGEDHMKGGVSFYFLDEEGVEELLAKVYGQDLSAQGTGEVKNSGTTYETVDKGLQGNV